MQVTREQHHKWLIEFYDVVPSILSKRDCTTDIIWSMHGAWSDLTLRCNYSFLAVTCSFLLTPFRGAMWIRRQNAPIWKEKPSHWHHTVANIEKTQLGKWIFLQLWIWAKVKSWIHASSCFFWLVQTSRTLRVGGWTKVLICVIMYCKDSGFQACGAPGGGTLLECFFCCGRSWS